MKEPLNRNEALKRIQRILREGSVSYSAHAKKELANDRLTTVDVTNVLRGGKIVKQPEEESATWRYRIETPRIAVVVAFRTDMELRIITAWRNKR